MNLQITNEEASFLWFFQCPKVYGRERLAYLTLREFLNVCLPSHFGQVVVTSVSQAQG